MKDLSKKCCANCIHNSGERHSSECALGKNQNRRKKPFYMVAYKRCAVIPSTDLLRG